MQETPHHGDRWFKEAVEHGTTREAIKTTIEALKQQAELGATSRFPDGALTPDDEGELRFAITAQGGQVVLAFGKPIEWVGMSPRIARQLADALSEWAAKA